MEVPGDELTLKQKKRFLNGFHDSFTQRGPFGYTISEAEARRYLVYDIDLKTEIHPLATLNDEFIGCIHKQLPDRHMIFSKDFTSLGCIPQERFEGVLKITLLVFNVARDNTRYTLSVSGQ